MGVVNLSKGGVVNLSKATVDLSKKDGGESQLKTVFVGLGWDSAAQIGKEVKEVVKKPSFFKRVFGGAEEEVVQVRQDIGEIDCDAFAVMYNPKDKSVSRETVWYGSLKTTGGEIRHAGDNLVGGSDGDDERITIDLNKIPEDITEILVGVNIYQGKSRGQHFGMLQNAYIRVVDEVRGQEMARYTLDNTYNGAVTLFFGKFKREGVEWEFEALGEVGKSGHIREVVADYLK